MHSLPGMITRRSFCRMAMAAGALLAMGCAAGRAEAQEGKPSKILFVSDRAGDKRLNIYTMNPDGTQQTALTKGEDIDIDPVWSPDGKRIAFISIAKSDVDKADKITANLYVMNADGSGRTRLDQSVAGVTALTPIWSPDGKRIAYGLAKLIASGPAAMQLVTVDSDGKNRKEAGEGLPSAWSPDGKRLLVVRGAETPTLYAVDTDGSNAKKVVEKGFLGKYSPDGKQILYLDLSQNSAPTLTLINADGTGVKKIAVGDTLFALGADWSADSKRLIFTGMKPPAGNSIPAMQVYAMDPDGGNVKALTTEGKINITSGGGIFAIGFRQQVK